jgi:hypothetical protein
MTPQLKQLAGAYFHQDYDLEYADEDAAVRDFARGQEESAVRELAQEIDSLLAKPLSESQFGDLWVKTLFAAYDPTADGWTYRDWFAHVRELLSTPGASVETD